jgi:penicillin-binding protein 1A
VSGRRPASGLPSTSRRRRRSRRKASGRRRRSLLVLLVVLVVAVAGGLAAGGLGAIAAFRSSCDLDTLTPVALGRSSPVLAADGSVLGVLPAERDHVPVALGAISPWLRTATVDVEDRRFYEHGGVDARGVARALWADLRAGRVVEGGSTITQQLVRNLYISRDQTLGRKVREACLAVKLTRRWSKERILGEYLNVVYYGNRAYGAEAAALAYFSVPARDLTLTQAALLAGLPQAPSAYDPLLRPDLALERRAQVLAAMREAGHITLRQEAAAASSPLGLRPRLAGDGAGEAALVGVVRDLLVEAYGAATVRAGGLRVQTAIDARLQRLGRVAVRRELVRPGDPAAAVVAVDPANGRVRVLASVPQPGAAPGLDLAAGSRRQAGSTFKAFVLAEAVAQGADPYRVRYRSAPFLYKPDPFTAGWRVSTYEGAYSGPLTLAQALVRSDNTVYARLTLDVGPERVADLARRLGVAAELPVVPALGLGAAAVSPLDLAAAYATLAAGGIAREPVLVTGVRLVDGRLDEETWEPARARRVLPATVAAEVTRVLAENVRSGTGRRSAIGRASAGKTGTTDDYADAWFTGYTPELATAVWVGYPEGEIPMRPIGGEQVTGGTVPAEIWAGFMRPALAGSAWRVFPRVAAPPRGTWDRRYAASTGRAPATAR